MEGLHVDRGGRSILRSISFTVEEGRWLMLVGPNGAGKSTLVEAVCGAIPSRGSIRLDGRELRDIARREVAQRIAVLSQERPTGFDHTVERVVSMGRYARQGGVFGQRDPGGESAVAAAMEAVGITQLRGRGIMSLSGGERQRVWLAQALAQEPELLILDEPSNHLDLRAAKELYELVDAWRRQPGRAAIAVVHDLSLALRYGTDCLLLDHGEQRGLGPCREVLTRERLREVWGMDVTGWMRELYAAWNEEA